jgi:hypothetical protein
MGFPDSFRLERGTRRDRTGCRRRLTIRHATALARHPALRQQQAQRPPKNKSDFCAPSANFRTAGHRGARLLKTPRKTMPPHRPALPPTSFSRDARHRAHQPPAIEPPAGQGLPAAATCRACDTFVGFTGPLAVRGCAGESCPEVSDR